MGSRILHWYVFKEHIGPFWLGVFTLTLILLMNQLFLLIWDVVGKGLAGGVVFQILFLYFPSIIALTIPMAVMVSSCMAFGRLAQDMEVLAFKSTGINPLTLNLLPLIILGIGGACSMVWFNDKVLPNTNHKLKNLLIEVTHKRPCFRLKALVTIKDLKDYEMQVGEVNYKEAKIKEIKLFEKKTKREIFAKKGKFYSQGDILILNLEDGEIHEPISTERYRRVKFSSYKVVLPLNKMYIQHSKDYRGRRELSLKGIKERIEKIKKEGKLTRYKKMKINTLLVEYHKRLAIPFASIVFIIIGCPCAIKVKKKGAGFGIALMFFIFFYICLIGGEHLGAKGKVSPWLAMWFPNILVGIGGIILNLQFVKR